MVATENKVKNSPEHMAFIALQDAIAFMEQPIHIRETIGLRVIAKAAMRGLEEKHGPFVHVRIAGEIGANEYF